MCKYRIFSNFQHAIYVQRRIHPVIHRRISRLQIVSSHVIYVYSRQPRAFVSYPRV